MGLRYILALSTSICLLSSVGCGDGGEDTDSGDVVMLGCGPNARLHGGLGNVEPHCDCNDGFKMYDGTCIPETTEETEGAENAPSDEMAENADSDPGGGQNTEPEMPDRALPASCWQPTGAECDPRGAVGCDVAAGETCDIAQTPGGEPNIVCLSGPNTQQLGDDCNPSSGPFCAAGLRCAPPGICKSFCCEDSDCSSGLRCEAFTAAAGSLGLCEDGTAAPACGSPGALCQSGSECCSNDCHAGHCH